MNKHGGIKQKEKRMKTKELSIRKKITMKKSLYLLGCALKLSYNVRNKISIFINILGFGMAFVPMIISQILREFTNEVYNLYVGKEQELNHALFLLIVLGILYIIQASYTAVISYYNREDIIRIHAFLKEHIMRCACKVQYKYIDGYENFREKVEGIKTHAGELVAQSMQQIVGCLQKLVTFLSLFVLLSKLIGGLY